MTIVHKFTNSIAARLSLGRRSERVLLETALRQLPSAAYWRLRERGFRPGGIIDIGAHEGNWTRLVRTIYPEPPILMIEARSEQERFLQRVCAELNSVGYALALLGPKPSQSIQFHVCGTGSSIYSERSDSQRAVRTMAMRTLDEVAAEFDSLAPPLFLKIDIQGAELDCLRGGEATLRISEVIQLEVALLNYNQGAPLAAEIIAFMDDRGFAIFDIAGFVRPNDVDLVQVDMIFAAKKSKLRPDFFQFSS